MPMHGAPQQVDEPLTRRAVAATDYGVSFFASPVMA
jgi:hypothetical protein